MNQAEITSGGFRDQMINGNITGIRDTLSDISTQLCGGFAGVNAGVANGFAQAEIAANARAMNDMQSMFGIQTALQNCCCDNRAGLADLKYTVATENCADRAAVESGIRDVITANTANTQAILDKLCQLELDGLKSDNANLRTQLNMANLAASQTAQTAQIESNIFDRLKSCPIPAQPVYGNSPIFTCGNNCGCGCGA